MALNLYDIYPNNTPDPISNPDYPIGKAQNESFPGAKDWFPLEKEWVNEILGFFGALLDDAGFTANGNRESSGNSQYLNAIKALNVPLDKLSPGTASLATGTIEIGNTANGKVTMVCQSGAVPGSLQSKAASSKTNAHLISLVSGGLRFSVAPGNQHTLFSILWPIDVYSVTFQSATVPYVLVDGQIFTGLNFGMVYKAELIMKSASNVLTMPLIGDFYSQAGTLALSEGKSIYTAGTIIPSSYTNHYIHLWIDAAIIS